LCEDSSVRSSGLDGPSWRSWALAAAALAVLLTLGALVATTGRSGRGTAGPQASVPPSDRLYIGGLDYSAYDGADAVYRVHADQIIHRKRKIGPLTLNPVKEIEIDGLRVDLFPRRAGRGPGALPPPPRSLDAILRELLESKSLGFVSRVTLENMILEDRSGAGEAFRFAAQEVVWRPGEKRLVVHGPFEHRDGTETLSGTGGAFDLTDDGRLVRVP
jgi:hypothetical protein